MTSPRGSSAVGRPAGGDEVATAPSPDGANRAEAVAVAALGQPAAEVAAPEAAPKPYDAGPAWARWLPPAVALARRGGDDRGGPPAAGRPDQDAGQRRCRAWRLLPHDVAT